MCDLKKQTDFLYKIFDMLMQVTGGNWLINTEISILLFLFLKQARIGGLQESLEAHFLLFKGGNTTFGFVEFLGEAVTIISDLK